MKLFLEAILGLAIAHSGFAQYAVNPDVLDRVHNPPYYPSTTDQPPHCHGNFTGPSDGTEGTITSPGWPNDYPANSACYWQISCEEHGLFPHISVQWGDVLMPVIWADDAASSCNGNGIYQHVAIKEPACPLYKGAYPRMSMDGTITGLEDLTRSSEYPGCIYVSLEGHVLFHSDGYTGIGFEIKYKCPETCKDEKDKKFCNKILKKKKCKKAALAKKCKKTCDKCDKRYARES